MVKEKWHTPDASKLDGHAEEVATLTKNYVREMNGSQVTSTNTELSQTSSRQTTPRTTQESPRETTFRNSTVIIEHDLSDDVFQETQQNTCSTTTTCLSSESASTQHGGTRTSSRECGILVREDTSERLGQLASSTGATGQSPTPSSTTSTLSLMANITGAKTSTCRKRRLRQAISPPVLKRRNLFRPLKDANSNRHLGEVVFNSQEKVIHIYANQGLRVQVHERLGES